MFYICTTVYNTKLDVQCAVLKSQTQKLSQGSIAQCGKRSCVQQSFQICRTFSPIMVTYGACALPMEPQSFPHQHLRQSCLLEEHLGGCHTIQAYRMGLRASKCLFRYTIFRRYNQYLLVLGGRGGTSKPPSFPTSTSSE